MSIRWSRARRDWLAAAVVAGAVALAWGLAHHFILGERRLQDPIGYTNDGMLALAVVGAARRGDFLPFASKELPSLGAPFVASWNDWPISEDLLFWLVGVLARLVDPVEALNLGYLTACVTASLAFFFVARRFGLRRDAAALGAVLFGLSNYQAVRGVIHYSLTFVWVVPWNLLVGAWLSSRRGVPFGSRRFALAALTTIGTAWGFFYYSFFAAQLYVLGTVAGVLRHGRSARRLKPVFALAGIFVVALGLVHLDSAAWIAGHGRNGHSIVRAWSDAEMYTLKPIELFIAAPEHRLGVMRTLARNEIRQAAISGEYPSPYLGLLGAAGLLALWVAAARKVMQGRSGPEVAWAGLAGWLVAVHATGGLNSLLFLLNAKLLRGTNRVSIVILAVALVFGGRLLGRLLARRRAPVRWASVAALATLGVLDQQAPDTAPIAAFRELAEGDRALTASMEAALEPGAMVFELPAMEFPEVPPRRGVDSYEMFRPTVFSRTLRFSHGDVKGRPNAAWKLRVAALPPAELVTTLRAALFSAVYLDRKGYEDHGAELERALVEFGCQRIAESPQHDTVAYALGMTRAKPGEGGEGLTAPPPPAAPSPSGTSPAGTR